MNPSETFLLVDFILFRHGHSDSAVILLRGLHGAVLVSHRGALGTLHGLAVHGFTNLAVVNQTVGVTATRPEVQILDVGCGGALGLLGGEINQLLNNLALLPGHGLTVLLAGPHLVSVIIDLPVGDAVVLCELLALG